VTVARLLFRAGRTTTADHAPYSKRVMAADMLGRMRRLGHRRFAPDELAGSLLAFLDAPRVAACG
jgi:hypothetical protein